MPTIVKVNWKYFEELVENLATKIQQSGKKYEYIVGVPRGGLIPAVMLSHILNIRMYPPTVWEPSDSEKILIVDDIADSGGTLKRFPKYIDTATIYCKIELEDKPTYWIGGCTKDEWIMFPYEKNINDTVSLVNYKDYHNETRDDIRI